MKKYVFSLLLCASGLATQSQVAQLPGVFTSGKTIWIVRAGARLNGISGDGVDATKNGWEKQKPNSKWRSSGDFKRALGDLDGYKNYDFGVISGVGFWFCHFNIDLGYQRGFVSIFEGDNTFLCDNLQVRLGYVSNKNKI